ncbi:MAG: AMP-binding protein, partial [Acidobacteria bacterium]|nr:AMP-binding protein [Acidobacteriota bacterium]
SGSTGRPKAVMVPHRGLVNYLLWSAEEYRLDGGNGAVVHSPISFDLTVTALFAPLLRGQRLVLVPEEQGIEGLTLTLAEGSDFSLVKLTPSHLEVVNQLLAEDQAAGRIRTLVLGGEALSQKSLAPWRRHSPATRIINEYGPTETVVGCTYYEVPAEAEPSESIPIGRPTANTRIYLLDESLQPVPVGVAGALHVAGVGVTRGYLGRPVETARSFLPDPFATAPGERLYRTGDRARFRPDGELEFLGREDHQVKIRGVRVEPGEIEAGLLEHPAISEAVVVARKDDLGELRLAAYLVGKDGEVPSAGELRRFLQEKLPEAMIPALFTPLPQLPLTANGKVDRSALPAPGVAQVDLDVAYVAPRSAVEEILAAIWAQILGVERVGIDDNFFSLGGDSLRSVRAVALAKERGLYASIEQLFEHQTIRELAPVMRTTEAALPPVQTRPFSLISEADRALLPEDVEDAYPLTTMQAGMLYHMQLNPDKPAYHNVNTWHLRAPFEREVFLEAVKRVVAHHAVLRTYFDVVNYSEPLQLVCREAELPVTFVDLRDLDPESQRAALDEFWERECREVFDISRAPFLRFHIHRRTDETFQFTLTESHAVVDGWSTSSTLAEVFELFLTLVKKKTPRIRRPLASSFREFVAMERQAHDSEESRRYWTDKLQGATSTRLLRWPGYPQSDLDTDYKKIYIDFRPEVVEGVRRVSHSVAVPLKTALLASHLKVMSLVSGSPEVLTGIITNGRPEQLDGDRIRGLFLNTVPVRVKLPAGSWTDLIRGTFDCEREMMPHRRYPISAMQKSWGRQPIFETTFNYLNFHSVEALLRSGELEVLEDDEKDFSFTNFTLDVNYFLSPATSNVRLTLEYDAKQIADPQALRLLGYFDRVLEAMALDNLAPHYGSSLLSAGERHLQQVEWNDTATPMPSEKSVAWQIAERAAATPEATAVMGGGEELSYGELHRRSNRLAHYLRSRGVGPESLVGLCVGRTVDMVVALLGVLKSGAAYLPLDPSYPEGRLRHMLEDGGVELVLSQETFRSRLPADGAEIVLLDADAAAIEAQSDADPEPLASLD